MRLIYRSFSVYQDLTTTSIFSPSAMLPRHQGINPRLDNAVSPNPLTDF